MARRAPDRPRPARTTPPGSRRGHAAHRRRRRARQIRRRRATALLVLALLFIGGGTISSRILGHGHGSQQADRASTAGRQFTVSTSGDILIHSPVAANALADGSDRVYDFTPMFAPIRPWVRGVDLAICHLETPLTEGTPSGFPLFNAPGDLADSIAKTGWEACDTASNHSLDQEQAGIAETGRLLDTARVGHTGSAGSAAAAERPLILRAGPARIGLLAYTDYTNGIPVPAPWAVNVLPAAEPAATKAARVSDDVRRALAAGADTVMVAMQWGDENSSEPNPSQRELAGRILALDGVAAIAGQGPHVVQPIEQINGKFVVFSAGNLLSNQGSYSGLPAATQDGLIALFRFEGTGSGYEVKRVEYVPVMVNPVGHIVLPTGRGAGSDPELAPALGDSWQRTVDVAGRGPGIRPLPSRRPGS